jgi:hypothetical protein
MASDVRHSLAALTGLVVLTTACAEPMSAREVIESTRPLALRIEVEDSKATPDQAVRCEALPFERVRLVPWIVDPEGPLSRAEIDTLEPAWIACNMLPIQGLGSCLEASFPLELDDLPECVPPDITEIDPQAGIIPVAPSPCRIVDGIPSQPEMTIPVDPGYLLGGDIEVTMIASTQDQTDTASCAEALLTEAQSFPDGCIYGVQRVPVGPDAALIQLATDFGIDLGTELGPVPEEIPDPDSNPRIRSFKVGVLNEEDPEATEVREVFRGASIEAEYGQTLAIVAKAPRTDLQTYFIPEDDDTLLEQEEVYTGLWFITWGELQGGSSNDPEARNQWSLWPGYQDDDEPPPADRATLFYVLRDDRQGVDWWWFHVDLTGDLD